MSFNPAFAAALLIQIVLVVCLWVGALVIGDAVFGFIVYVYWPPIYALEKVFRPAGEFGGLCLGLPVGVLIYSAIVGAAFEIRHRRKMRSVGTDKQ